MVLPALFLATRIDLVVGVEIATIVETALAIADTPLHHQAAVAVVVVLDPDAVTRPNASGHRPHKLLW